MKSYLGLIGAGVMGQSLSLNIARNGYSISVFDKDPNKALAFKREKASSIESISAFSDFSEFIDSLDTPKKVLLLIPAGNAVDSVIDELKPVLNANDLILDCGNSFYKDTLRREQDLKQLGIYYFGVGISGGEKGALEGPSIMPGGDHEIYNKYLADLLTKISAHTDEGDPCCDYIGPDGAGHYVKMVHNGIEYGDIQIICEAYDLMKKVYKMSNQEISEIFAKWNNGRLNSYLIDITSKILTVKDEVTGKDMVDVILDEAGQKGTGKWTSMEALDMGVPVPTIAESVFARCVSARKHERVEASNAFPKKTIEISGPKEFFLSDLEKAVYFSKIIAYSQGFAQLKEASKEYHWNLQLGDIALLWREGCIIRARFLNRIKKAFDENPDLDNLIMSSEFGEELKNSEDSLRSISVLAIRNGIYAPALINSIMYFDGFTSEQLPANLLQAQRDWFGAHKYHRIDCPESETFHTVWEKK